MSNPNQLDSAEAAREQIDDPEGGSTWFFSLAGVVIFVATVLVISSMYFSSAHNAELTRVIDVPVTELVNARQAQKAKLAEYGNYTIQLPGEGTKPGPTITKLRIPIDTAMQVVGAELSGAQVSSSSGTGGASK